MPSLNCLKMTNKEIYYFTGKCLSLDENPGFKSEIIEKCKNDLIGWEQFVGLCNNHLILPAIYLKFQSHGIIEYLPVDLAEFLKEVHHLNSVRNDLIIQQLQEIMSILNEHEIFPTLLKGAGNLIDELYADIGERILGDIDFLVPEKDYLLSSELMKNKGYSTVSAIPAYSDIKTMKHYPRIYHPDFPAVIEIHRLPVREEYQSWFNTEIIDQEKKTVSSLSGCFVESDNHKIIHNFIHSQLSNKGYLHGIVSFRDLYDLYLLSKRTEVKNTIAHIKTKQIAISYFAFAGKVFGINERFYFKGNFSSWLFEKKHTLNLNSNTFYRTHLSILFFAERILKGYAGQFVKSFYSGKMRQSVIRRLSDRNWYGDHIKLYTRFFKKKQ
jgi:hypothetical protein